MQIQRLETITRLGLYDCDLSPDGAAVAAAYQEDEGYYLGIWSTAACRPVLRADLPGAYRRPRFDPRGRRLAAARDGEQVVVWSLPGGEEILAQGRQGGGDITAHAFGPDGETLAIAQGDRVSLWRVDSGEWLASLSMPGEIDVLRSSADGLLLGVGLHGGGVVVVDVEARRTVATLPAIDRGVTALGFHPAQPWLMAATAPLFARAGSRWQRSEHGWAYVWNYYTGEEIARIVCDYQAVLLGRGQYVATLTNNSRSLWVWQILPTDLVAHIENAVPELLIDEEGNEIRRATLASTPAGDVLAVAGLTRPISAVGVLRLFAFQAESVAQAR